MILSDLIKTLSQAAGGMQRQTVTPMAKKMSESYQARSPWAKKVIDRQSALTGDMLQRMRDKQLAQWKYSKDKQTYKRQLTDYIQKRKALGRSDSSLYGEAPLQGAAREKYVESILGARPEAPQAYTPSTAYKKMRYQKPARSIQPTANRARFLRGVKFE